MSDCLFCKMVSGEIPVKKVWEDDRAFAIEDINPQAPVHLLVIPKKHIATLLEVSESDKEVLASVFSAAQKLAKEKGLDQRGFRLVANCLEEAGQTVFHLHFHFLGGRAMKWPPG